VTENAERIALDMDIDDLDVARSLNAKLRNGACVLDWQRVEVVTEAFAETLVSGLSLPDVIDALNPDSMSPTVQDLLLAAFQSAGTAKRPSCRRSPVSVGIGPGAPKS